MDIQSLKQRFAIIGRSPLLDQVLSTALRVAPTDLTVLITGESGTGKEVFSKIIHSLSPRKHESFIAVNCGAIPPGTINSELFGHVKGAFTGATSDRKGYFETVDKGTIFLDEVAEMPLDTQAFLLRILETGEFLRVGSSSVLKTDVRVIVATNIDLLDRIKAGKFRQDLYYRLNTVPIKVPSLKERREDIMMLFRRFTVDFAEKYRSTLIQLDEEAKFLLENYSWPGNIRELKNMAEQLSVLTEDKMISAADIRRLVPDIARRNLPAITRNGDKTDFQEREILYKLLFDMKSDLNDLKSLVFELIHANDLNISDISRLSAGSGISKPGETIVPASDSTEQSLAPYVEDQSKDLKPIVIQPHSNQPYNEMEVVEENLSLEEMEKELINKALKKHRGRRKEAAEDLGISERTLYRKIKYYNL